MIDYHQPTAAELRKFGILFALLACAGGLAMLWKGTASWWVLLVLSGFFLLTGLVLQQVLRPLYTAWMRFAYVLGWINTRILLGLVFFLVMTPAGIVFRLFGKKLLETGADPKAETYWKPKSREPYDKRGNEHLF